MLTDLTVLRLVMAHVHYWRPGTHNVPTLVMHGFDQQVELTISGLVRVSRLGVAREYSLRTIDVKDHFGGIKKCDRHTYIKLEWSLGGFQMDSIDKEHTMCQHCLRANVGFFTKLMHFLKC